MGTGVSGVAFALSLASALALSGPPEMKDLSFMSGCWEGSFGSEGGRIEEIYTSPSGNLILGTTRYLRDGAAIQYEFSRIRKTDEGIVLTPYPDGRPSEHDFRLTSLTEAEAIFEAPEHDFPKRIIYRVNADGSHTVRIDGGKEDDSGKEWVMKAVPCPGSRPK